MKPTISAFYQCYKQPKAFLRALTLFRQYYPQSAVMLVSDGGGYDYSSVAKHFYCHYDRLAQQTGQNETTFFSSRHSLLEWISRLVKTAQTATEEYIFLLEDDVWVMKEINSPLLFDINGANTQEFLGPQIEQYLKRQGKIGPGKNGKFYYGGCGGSLFKRSFILNNFSNLENIEKIIIECEPYREGRSENAYPTDYWISLLTYYLGGTVGAYDGFCETWYPTYLFRRYVLKNIEVLHHAKSFYNKKLTADEQKIVGEFTL